MNAEQNFRRYVEEGPDVVGLEATRAALDFRESSPAEALRVTRRVERERRQAEEEETARSLWLARGGDEKAFGAAYKEISDEKRKEEVAAIEWEAREASRRYAWRTW